MKYPHMITTCENILLECEDVQTQIASRSMECLVHLWKNQLASVKISGRSDMAMSNASFPLVISVSLLPHLCLAVLSLTKA